MANKPRRRKYDSEKQQMVISRFTEATQYVKGQMTNPGAKAEYQKAISPTRPNAYVVALCDYLNAPIIKQIDASSYMGTIGGELTIKATDDFKVVRVKVEIIHPDGLLLEEGEAVPAIRKPNVWRYRNTVANGNLIGTVIKAMAYDKPGNVGSAEIVLGSQVAD